MTRPFHCTTEGQLKMANDALHTSAKRMLMSHIETMERKHKAMVEEWRKAGMPDKLGKDCDDYDLEIQKQLAIWGEM